MAVSSRGLQSNTTYQAGGTLTAVLGKWSGRKIDSGYDEMGCFSWVRLRGKRGRKITFITAYRVSQSSGACLGVGTFFVQKQTNMRLKVISGTPREYVLCALHSSIISRRSIAEDIILTMDANEALQKTGRMREFFISTGLIDVMERHGTAPRTCLRRSSRINFIFVTPGWNHPSVRQGILGYMIPSLPTMQAYGWNSMALKSSKGQWIMWYKK